MAKIYNSDLIKGLQQNTGIQQNRDKTPDELAEKVVPVIETNPELLQKANVVKNVILSNSTSATLWTTPSDRDFYLCSAGLSFIKDAGNLSTYIRITFTDEFGLTPSIMYLACLSSTAQSGNEALSFKPIKLKRNTVITINCDSNAANIRGTAWIIGYINESGA